MGIISLEKSNHLYWLGRYSERAFTTVRSFMDAYDTMIDADANAYQNVCKELMIPDIYGSKEAFIKNYLFDAKDPNSIYTTLTRAYDNAMVLRDILSSETLAYIQMALDVLEEAKDNKFNLLELQSVLDYLYAFWGSIDDCVNSSTSRNILRFGRQVERVDLYIRLGYKQTAIKWAFNRLEYRLGRSQLDYDTYNLQVVSDAVKLERDLNKVLYNLNNIYKG